MHKFSFNLSVGLRLCGSQSCRFVPFRHLEGNCEAALVEQGRCAGAVALMLSDVEWCSILFYLHKWCVREQWC